PATTCTEASGIRTCDLWAKAGTLTLPGSVTANIWGYAADSISPAGIPGPMLIMNQGETLQVVLHNGLTEATSLTVPGAYGPADRTGVAAGGSKTYTYAGLQPGTYLYQAGPTANGQRQVAMGMHGVLIVRPAGSPLEAYGPASAFDNEAVLIMSEIDINLNANPTGFDMHDFNPRYFLFNGQAYPNTVAIDTVANQKVLLRLVNAGLQNHSLGVLGLRYLVLATDGKPFDQPHYAVAETLSAGQTADVLVQVPVDAPQNMKYAVYDSSLRLINNGAAFGGMLTFMNIAEIPSGTDTTGPAMSGLSLSPNPSNGSSPIAFNASASDAGTVSGTVAAVEYFIDTTGTNGAGTAMSAQDGTFDSVTEAAVASIDPTALTAGFHTIYVHGLDAVGNWGPFNTIVLNLDKQGPATTGLKATPNPSNGTLAVALSGTANDSTSGNSNIQAAEYFIDSAGANGTGTALIINQTASIASITATISAPTLAGLADGYHPIYVHSRDVLGNWGAFATMQLAVDKNGPATSAIQLRPNPNNGALPYAPTLQSVRVDAAFTEPGPGLVTSTIKNAEFFIDAVSANGTGILMTPVDGSFNTATENGYAYIPLITVNALSNGNHTISIHGQDASGNWGPLATATLIIDKVAPTVSGMTLAPAATNNTAVVVSATGNDVATGNSNITGGEYFIDAAGSAGTGIAMNASAPSPNASISATISSASISALTAGNHTVYVRAKDAAGNWSATTSATLTVDRTPPTFSSITLTPNSIPAGTASITMTVNGSSDGAGGSGVTGGEYWFGSTNITAGTGTAFSGLNTPIPTNSLAAGTYTVRVRIRDAAGNWSTGANGVRTATLTVTSPALPIYFSTIDGNNPPGLTGGDDADIYYFNGTTFSRVIDANGAGSLGLPSGADVDGFDRVDATHFYMSFDGSVAVPVLGTVQDEDVVYYNNGTWSLFFDGSVNLVGSTDLDAISVVGGTLYFSTDNTTIPNGVGGSGDDADIYRWNGGSSYTRVFDASTLSHWSTTNVDGFVYVNATHYYISFSSGTSVTGIASVQDEDVLYYNGSSWSVYFDGTPYISGDDVDAFDIP
ncbi:MAG TPA: multicopper oxidase domain-containing protein, partial [Anaerolineales bacterium]|nr:multicopper oxidase domain-containing protein [Anaerolineales bacterium]